MSLSREAQAAKDAYYATLREDPDGYADGWEHAANAVIRHDERRAQIEQAAEHLRTWQRQAGPGHPLGKPVRDALTALGKDPEDL